MALNDDILVKILKHVGSVYMIGRDYTVQTERAGSLRIAACVNTRLRRIVHAAASEVCLMSDAHAFDICTDCPRMAATVFAHCDEVRIGPNASRALSKDASAITNIADKHFRRLRHIHVTGAELPVGLALALTSSQCAPVDYWPPVSRRPLNRQQAAPNVAKSCQNISRTWLQRAYTVCRSLESLALEHCAFVLEPPATLMHPPPTLRHYSLRGSVILAPPPQPPATPDANVPTPTNFHPAFFADLHHHCPFLETLVLPPLRYYNLLACAPSLVAPSLFDRLKTPAAAAANPPNPTAQPPEPDPDIPDAPSPLPAPAPPPESPDFEPVHAFRQWLSLLPDEWVPEEYTARPFQLPHTLSYASPALTALDLVFAEDPALPRGRYYYREAVLSHLPALRSLSISFTGAHVPVLRTNLPAVSTCSHLTSLCVNGVFCDFRTFREFARTALPALAHLHHLTARNLCVPPSPTDGFLGPHRELLHAAAGLTGLRHLQIVQDRPRCNFDMLPSQMGHVAALTALTFLELSPMRWMPPDPALAAAGGADGAVAAGVPAHIVQVVEWAFNGPEPLGAGAAGGAAAAAEYAAAQVNLGGLKAVLQCCPSLRELRLQSLVPVPLDETSQRVRTCSHMPSLLTPWLPSPRSQAHT